MNLKERLVKLQKRDKLTIDAMFLALNAAGVVVSTNTVGNWLRNANDPSPMYRQPLENFLHENGV